MKKGEDARWLLVSGWRGTTAAGHFKKLAAVLAAAAFEAAEADRTMEDLRHLAYRNGVIAALVFQFVDPELLRTDVGLSQAKHDLETLSCNVPFLRVLYGFCANLQATKGSLSEAALSYVGRLAGVGASDAASPLLLQLCEDFKSGRDHVLSGHAGSACPVFVSSSTEPFTRRSG